MWVRVWKKSQRWQQDWSLQQPSTRKQRRCPGGWFGTPLLLKFRRRQDVQEKAPGQLFACSTLTAVMAAAAQAPAGAACVRADEIGNCTAEATWGEPVRRVDVCLGLQLRLRRVRAGVSTYGREKELGMRGGGYPGKLQGSYVGLCRRQRCWHLVAR